MGAAAAAAFRRARSSALMTKEEAGVVVTVSNVTRRSRSDDMATRERFGNSRKDLVYSESALCKQLIRNVVGHVE